MILEEETFEVYEHYLSELSPHSNAPILAACDDCGKVRITSKDSYFALCRSCCHKGDKNPNYGKHLTKETKVKMSEAKKGDKNPSFKDGLWAKDPKEYDRLYNRKYLKTTNGKNKDKRNKAKRKRELGYTLILPLAEGDVGHHVTDEYVVGIPKDAHEKLSGYSRKRHRASVLEWLKANDVKKYRLVLSVLKENC